MSYNKIILVGRLTHDPQIKLTPSGKKVTSFSIAVGSKRKDSTGLYITDFFNITAWEKTAEHIVKYFGKGKEILIEGELRSRSYEKNGEKRNVVEVEVKEVQFVGTKPQMPPAETGPYTPAMTADAARDELENISDDDLPF